MGPRCAGVVYIWTSSKPRFGRDNETARCGRAACAPAPEKFFRRATTIDVSGIDYVAASIEEGIEDSECLLLGGLSPKTHGSEDSRSTGQNFRVCDISCIMPSLT